MDYSFTDEQEQFRSIVQRFLKEKSPTSEVRRLMETEEGYDPNVWRQLSEDLGLPAIPIPEAYGGAGFGPVELGIVMEELGRSLLCAPYFSSTVLAANAILNAAFESQKLDLLPAIASGERLATLVVTEPNGRWDAAGIECIASPTADGFQLSGTKSFVLDGCLADLLVVVARNPGSAGNEGLSLFTLAGNADGVT
ncbi:MAG: acyl-CoA dehydrogenase family protein, partial [Pseudomonadales bacterium]